MNRPVQEFYTTDLSRRWARSRVVQTGRHFSMHELLLECSFMVVVMGCLCFCVLFSRLMKKHDCDCGEIFRLIV